MDNSNIFQRIGIDWIGIEYGDYIVGICGINSNQNNYRERKYATLTQTYRKLVNKLFMIFNRLWLSDEREDAHSFYLEPIGFHFFSFSLNPIAGFRVVGHVVGIRTPHSTVYYGLSS